MSRYDRRLLRAVTLVGSGAATTTATAPKSHPLDINSDLGHLDRGALARKATMRVLVLWADDESSNLGVRALAEGSAALVRSVWPDAQVDFQHYGRGSAPMGIGRPRSLAREWVTRRHGLVTWLRSFDLIVDTRSGDSFADIYGVERLFSMSVITELAARAGVPVVLGPQTIGPFRTVRGRLVARRALRTAALVLSRDANSTKQAADLGRPVDLQTTDVVFAIPAPERQVVRDVVFNVSGLLWSPNPHVDSESYRRTVHDLYQELTSQGRKVSLLAHVLDSSVADNDVPAIREFVELNGLDAEVLIPSSLTHVRELVASANVVVGSRMHACLNALSVGTAAIPLAYSRKFAPLLAGLGWNHTIDLRTHPDPVDAVLEQLAIPDLAVQATAVRDRARASLLQAEHALKVLVTL